MSKINDIIAVLDSFAPNELAESWDNVGLLIGDADRDARSIVTCLTVTTETVQEAIEKNVDLIVSHHPFPFHATKRITVETSTGRMIWELIRAGISVYSPHTAHDNAEYGINRQLADFLGLIELRSITETGGRIGRLPDRTLFSDLVTKVKDSLKLSAIQYVDSGKRLVSTIAIGCGAAGEFLEPAKNAGADVLLLGEARFHTALEAKAFGISLIIPGHYASERFAMEVLARRIFEKFPNVRCFASERETDPIQYSTK